MKPVVVHLAALTEPPPFHTQGPGHFSLIGSYDDSGHARHVADEVIAHLRDNAPQTARRVLETGADELDSGDLTALRVRVAAGLLYDRADKQALALAEQTIEDGSHEALWTAGLAAYRLGRMDKAGDYFKSVAEAGQDPWTRGAAAFWAARALTVSGDADGARRWLHIAAERKGTFYGILAQRRLDDADAIERKTISSHNSSYATPRWKPQNGFTVDPALIFAIMRQESKFDPQAQSEAGALGLMQIMPGTAGEVTQRDADWQSELLNPETNMDIGQRYVRSLLQSEGVGNNLIKMMVAYNCGPNALDKYRHSAAETDPLMFIETLPAGETRGFVEQVMANYWNYRLRLGEDTASLSAVAAGKWAMYSAPKGKPTLLADAR